MAATRPVLVAAENHVVYLHTSECLRHLAAHAFRQHPDRSGYAFVLLSTDAFSTLGNPSKALLNNIAECTLKVALFVRTPLLSMLCAKFLSGWVGAIVCCSSGVFMLWLAWAAMLPAQVLIFQHPKSVRDKWSGTTLTISVYTRPAAIHSHVEVSCECIGLVDCTPRWLEMYHNKKQVVRPGLESLARHSLTRCSYQMALQWKRGNMHGIDIALRCSDTKFHDRVWHFLGFKRRVSRAYYCWCTTLTISVYGRIAAMYSHPEISRCECIAAVQLHTKMVGVIPQQCFLSL